MSFTFDDARLSQTDIALPILDAAGVRATFYVTPDAVQRRLDQWRSAIARGHEIGNHSLKHPCSGNFPWSRDRALEDYTLDRMEQELLAASDAIESLLGARPVTFAYPCGQTFVGRGAQHQSYIPLVRKLFLAGRGFMAESHNAPAYCNLAHLCGRDFDCASLETVLGWIESATNDGGWLLLAAHDVGGQARQTVPRDVLSELCQRLAARPEIWVDTVAAVARQIRERVPGA